MSQAAYVFLIFSAMLATALRAQTFSTVATLGGHGQLPMGALVQGPDGNLYGAAQAGGSKGLGTIFEVTPNGMVRTLYSFCQLAGCTDGELPNPIIVYPGGTVYGTTLGGGVNKGGGSGCSDNGCGTIFKITPAGVLTTLYNFCSLPQCADGSGPGGGLFVAANGDLYGTTQGLNGAGTVFHFTPGGALTTLHSFCKQTGCPDGYSPEAPPIQGTDGGFYGTTEFGGNGEPVCGMHGCGTIYKITSGGKFTSLYRFCSQPNCTDGSLPLNGALIQASDGNLYGTTWQGGANGAGTVFKISPSGTYATVYSFCGGSNCSNGNSPSTGLIQATDGNLYGTTMYGGTTSCSFIGGCGTIFEITLAGTLTTLYSFDSPGFPNYTLVQDTSGTFYGTTEFSAPGIEHSSVYSLSVGLAPFVEPQPTSGKPGNTISILGTELSGATSVTFNGATAAFRVVGSSLITAVVPEGATTGTMQVLTPGGTLASDVPFRVLP